MYAPDEMADDRLSLKATGRLLAWTLAWTATLAVARFGPEHLWDSNEAASWVAVAANLVAGVGWIIAFIRFLGHLDELQRKITQDALAVTLGVGWIAGFAYVVADAAGLVTFDVDAGALPVLMGVVYLLTIAAGNLRYR